MKPRYSTPAKLTLGSNANTDSPTSTLHRRSLFNSTPRTHESNGQSNDASLSSPVVNGLKSRSLKFEDSFSEQKDNPTSPTKSTDSEEEVIVIDDDDDDEENNDTNNKLKIETNNNNHQFVKKVQLAEQSNHTNAIATQSMPKSSKSQVSMLKTALCPRTPLLKTKRDAFFTYRDQNTASPMLNQIDAVRENNDSLVHNTSDIYDSPGYMERHIKNADLEKGLECIGRELAKEQKVEWCEYWDFLNQFVDIASEKGLQKFEKYLNDRHTEENIKKLKLKNKNTQKQPNTVILDDVCSALEKFGFSLSNDNRAAAGQECRNENVRERHNSGSSKNAFTAHQSSTPYTYVEKSLQVYARRMTKTIIHNIDNVLAINDALLLELRRVKMLIYSFKEDAVFRDVNFEKVHSRIGNLIAIFLQNSQEVTQDMQEQIVIILQNLLLTPGERREHIACVCDRIYEILENPGNFKF